MTAGERKTVIEVQRQFFAARLNVKDSAYASGYLEKVEEAGLEVLYRHLRGSYMAGKESGKKVVESGA